MNATVLSLCNIARYGKHRGRIDFLIRKEIWWISFYKQYLHEIYFYKKFFKIYFKLRNWKSR